MQERERLEAQLAEARKQDVAKAPSGAAITIGGVSVIVEDVATQDRDEVSLRADTFRKDRKASIYILMEERGVFHVVLTDDLLKAGRKAGDLVNKLVVIGGGKGGGRPYFASAGIGDMSKLAEARAAVPSVVEAWLVHRPDA